jgi:uncharacterized membrane protein
MINYINSHLVKYASRFLELLSKRKLRSSKEVLYGMAHILHKLSDMSYAFSISTWNAWMCDLSYTSFSSTRLVGNMCMNLKGHGLLSPNVQG